MVRLVGPAGNRRSEAGGDPPVTSAPNQSLQRPREAVGFTRKRANSLFGVKAVGSFLPALTRKAFEKYGFSTASVVTDWAAIAGVELAAYTAPERLKWPRGGERTEEDGPAAGPKSRQGATLVLRVDGARALDVQYKARQIIERINAYFGYAAIAELRTVQAPIGSGPASASPPIRRPVAPLTQEVASIADPGLRSALARLGAGVRAGR
jgi:hypothetical protein